MGMFYADNLRWDNPGPEDQIIVTAPSGFVLDPGLNVYALISLSRVDIDKAGGFVRAGIYDWEQYADDGSVIKGGPEFWLYSANLVVNNCRSVRFVMQAQYARGVAAFSLSTF